jgi:hypothetical protein
MIDWSSRYASRAERMVASEIRELLEGIRRLGTLLK